MKTLGKVVLVAALGVAATANAAQDGNLGATSAGESVVTLIKDNAVMITDVGDLDLGTHNSTAGDLTASDDVCVFNSSGTYSVTVTSTSSAFNLVDGGNTIPYSLSWIDNVATVPSPVVYNTALTGMQGDTNSTSCGGGTNATFAVTVAANDFNSAPPGSYADTMTLTVTPL